MSNPLAKLTDEELTRSLKTLVKSERRRSVDILKHLNEMDRRRVAERGGFPSLFEYCVTELRYINGTAARLIHAARAAKKFEILFKTMERGLLSVTTVSMLAPHLTWANHRRLIRRAAGKSAREVEALVASLTPVSTVPRERVRFLAVAAPAPAPPQEPGDLFSSPKENSFPGEGTAADCSRSPAIDSPPAAETTVAPVGPVSPVAPVGPSPAVSRRVHFSFTADESLLRDVERVKELSRHRWPAGKYSDVFAGAVKALLEKIDPDRRRRRKDRVRRRAAGARSRDISRAVKDEVWDRDGGRCAYAAPGGRVCGARAGLEFDHVRPWALGGGSGDAGNVRLLCRAHNDLEARRAFGGALVDAAVARRRDGLRSGVKI